MRVLEPWHGRRLLGAVQCSSAVLGAQSRGLARLIHIVQSSLLRDQPVFCFCICSYYISSFSRYHHQLQIQLQADLRTPSFCAIPLHPPSNRISYHPRSQCDYSTYGALLQLALPCSCVQVARIALPRTTPLDFSPPATPGPAKPPPFIRLVSCLALSCPSSARPSVRSDILTSNASLTTLLSSFEFAARSLSQSDVSTSHLSQYAGQPSRLRFDQRC